MNEKTPPMAILLGCLYGAIAVAFTTAVVVGLAAVTYKIFLWGFK